VGFDRALRRGKQFGKFELCAGVAMKNGNDNKTVDWVAPEFKLGDLVVYQDFHIDFLLKIDLLIDSATVGYRGAKRSHMFFQGYADIESIRHATKEERRTGERVEACQ